MECYQKAVDVNSIVSITDQDGKIIYANEKFCEISEFLKSELIGRTHNVISSGYHSKEFFADLWRTIKNGNIWNGEIRNRTKTGNFYWVDTVIIPVKIEFDTQYLSLRTVITERKELEEKKAEYYKSIEQLLFMTSHKIRGPLTSIMGLIQVNKENISDEDLNRSLQYLQTSTDELDQFTKEMTNYLHYLKKLMD